MPPLPWEDSSRCHSRKVSVFSLIEKKTQNSYKFSSVSSCKYHKSLLPRIQKLVFDTPYSSKYWVSHGLALLSSTTGRRHHRSYQSPSCKNPTSSSSAIFGSTDSDDGNRGGPFRARNLLPFCVILDHKRACRNLEFDVFIESYMISNVAATS